MHILISGGWGYRNLGDDAILVSTVKLLQTCYDDVQLTVLSYAKDESKMILDSSISAHSSVDYLLHSGSFELINYKNQNIYQKITKKINIINHFFSTNADRMKAKIHNEVKVLLDSNNDIIQCFKSCDLFLLSGGGYINNWETSLVSKCIEVELASYFKKRIILFGVTIGPFGRNKYETCFAEYFKKIELACVRDIESKADCIRLGVPVDDLVIPDIALFEETILEKKNGVVTIIPFYGIEQHLDTIILAMRKCRNIKKVVVTISQLWWFTKKNAELIYSRLVDEGFLVSLMYPSDYKELEGILGSSGLVISQNLHGLILAYRCGTPIISLNDARKFKTFMDLIGERHNLLPIKSLNSEQLSKAMSDNLNKSRCNFASKEFRKVLLSKIKAVINEF